MSFRCLGKRYKAGGSKNARIFCINNITAELRSWLFVRKYLFQEKLQPVAKRDETLHQKGSSTSFKIYTLNSPRPKPQNTVSFFCYVVQEGDVSS